MKITEHDEFLHLGYPKDASDPWKENYYFNYIDREANAMGIFHCSFMRFDNQVRITTLQLIDGKHYSYREFFPLPLTDPELLNDQLIMKSDKWRFEILEPNKHHRLSFQEGDLSVILNFTDRFEVFNFDETVSNEEDKGFDMAHYEQGMRVEGEVIVGGKPRTINCYGHRDHSWGFRDESGLGGWHWIAIQGEKSAWNITRVKRIGKPDDQTGFVSEANDSHLIVAVEVMDIQYNDKEEPVVCKYKVQLDNGETKNITASRFARLNVGENDPDAKVVFYENMSEIVIEETGEKGVGVDEHMVVPIL